MAVAVNMPNRRQEPSEDEKLMQIIMTGLKVADTVYGIKDAGEKNKLLAEQNKLSQDQKDRAELFQQEQFKYQKTKDARDYALKVDEKNKDIGKTKGREAADVAFGKEYTDYNAAGGYAGVEKNLNALENAAKVLESKEGSDFTGPGGGLMSAIGVRKFTNPEAVALKQQVQQAVQSTLRATLGPQFTEKEGQGIMDRAYDESLPPAQNVVKLRAAIQELGQIAQSKDAASKYFEQHGTLTGFNPAQSRGQMQAQGGQQKQNMKTPKELVGLSPQEQLMQVKKAIQLKEIEQQGIGGAIKKGK